MRLLLAVATACAIACTFACGGGGADPPSFLACRSAPDLAAHYGQPCNPGLGEGWYGGNPCSWQGQTYASCIPVRVGGEACDPAAAAECATPLRCVDGVCDP